MPRRRSFSLRSHGDSRTSPTEEREHILGRLSDSLAPAEDTVSDDDSTYYTNGPSGSAAASSSPYVQTRSSASWVSSLRSLLKRLPKSPTKHGQAAEPVTLAGIIDDTVPQNEEELNAFLDDVWRKNLADSPHTSSSPGPVSNYSKRITELKDLFDCKMAEISQREATYINELMSCDDTTPLITASQIASIDEELRRMMLESKLSYKFDKLRLRLKQEVAQTVLGLQSEYIQAGPPQKNQRLKSKATKLLNEWFDFHLDNPYPSEAEKQLLAYQCGITVEQLSTWFCNKRSRSKKMLALHGRQSKTL
ncbi:homeobox protein ceh-20-like [Halichondria panicea]|uniref:homeobox protein ceh-20-like n=1 Tax=Halichondria panicea TaxID=6063 RepID=UPI00312B46B9